jgi:hydroxyethylthiazole kinase-like sugar kinase family protein
MNTENSRTRLLDAVIEQIKADVATGNFDEIIKLIHELPADVLMNYLLES